MTRTPQFEQLLATHDVVPHTAEVGEVMGLYTKAIRAMADSELAGLSAEGAVTRAYDAARLAATAVLHRAGYRVKSTTGHHHRLFYALKYLGEPAFAPMADRLEAARNARRDAAYDAQTDDVFFREELAALHHTLHELLPVVHAWLTSRGVSSLPHPPHASGA
jgi:hypothetical protein